jgi:hypothetical protein
MLNLNTREGTRISLFPQTKSASADLRGARDIPANNF